MRKARWGMVGLVMLALLVMAAAPLLTGSKHGVCHVNARQGIFDYFEYIEVGELNGHFYGGNPNLPKHGAWDGNVLRWDFVTELGDEDCDGQTDATATPQPTATNTPEPSPTDTLEPTATETPTETLIPTDTETATATATGTLLSCEGGVLTETDEGVVCVPFTATATGTASPTPNQLTETPDITTGCDGPNSPTALPDGTICHRGSG